MVTSSASSSSSSVVLGDINTTSSSSSSSSSNSPIIDSGRAPDKVNRRPANTADMSSITPSMKQESATTNKTPSATIISNLLTHSTIYRRHEARLSKTYALRDDTRPAFLRVLSGLPLFRTIVKPYNNHLPSSTSSSSSTILPTGGSKQEQQQAQQNNRFPKITGTISIGDYSEETLFTPSDVATVATTATATATATAINYISSNNDGTTLTSERVLQAMLATGVCSGFAEYMFGIKSTTSSSSSSLSYLSSSSPFRKQQHITGLSPPPLLPPKTLTTNVHFPLFFRPEATAAASSLSSLSSSLSDAATAFGVYTNKNSSSSNAHEKILPNNASNANMNNNNTTSASSTRTTTTTTSTTMPFTRPFAVVLTTALSTSVLFGTKIFLDATITENNNKRHHDQYGMDYYSRRPTTTTATTTTGASSILSSAIAGGVVGISRLALLEVQRRRQQQKQHQANHLQSQQKQQQHQKQQLNSNYSLRFMGRNVLAAILYFSIYGSVSSFSSSSSSSSLSRTTPMDDSYDADTNKSYISEKEKKGTMSILTGGALAGIAHVFTMNYHHYYHHGINTPPTIIWWTRIMIPATVRAVPIHAMIFYGYEQMKEGVAC